jgi:phage terminase large subunit
MDWHNPDYAAIFRIRMANLEKLRRHPEKLLQLKAYYADHPAYFINDWGVTFDPRNADIGLPTLIPFILFQKQRDWVDWVVARWRAREPGICEKSRDMGVSWLAMSLSCTLCLFHDGVAIGVGSRKAEYVDKIGTLKPLLPKGRMFMEHLPVEFRGQWEGWRDAPYMRISFPATGSLIGGESGDGIGRGDRNSITFVDESAHLERQELVDAALSQTTNCRIDMSSVNGMGNSFEKRRHGGKIKVFVFDWRDDPRKDEEWYAKQCELLDEVVVAQEIDRDYSAAVEGIVLPGLWVRACIDALAKLGIAPAGHRGMALDVADEGADRNAVCRVEGVQIVGSEDWSGKGADLFATAERAFALCDEHGYPGFRYDADGLGAGIRGDARVINDRRKERGQRPRQVVGFRGSEGVFDPEGIVEGTLGDSSSNDKGRTNQDYFANRKAQAWWSMRRRVQRTYRWIVKGIPCSPDEILSISSKCPNHLNLVSEMSQATYSVNGVGKILINKKPNGMKSPNLADAAVIRYAPMEAAPVPISGEILRQVANAGRRR